jgi:hypothetical protein
VNTIQCPCSMSKEVTSRDQNKRVRCRPSAYAGDQFWPDKVGSEPVLVGVHARKIGWQRNGHPIQE